MKGKIKEVVLAKHGLDANHYTRDIVVSVAEIGDVSTSGTAYIATTCGLHFDALAEVADLLVGIDVEVTNENDKYYITEFKNPDLLREAVTIGKLRLKLKELKQFGSHYGAAHDWIQRNCVNGSTVTWFSDSPLLLRRALTPKIIEEVSLAAAKAVMKDVDTELSAAFWRRKQIVSPETDK